MRRITFKVIFTMRDVFKCDDLTEEPYDQGFLSNTKVNVKQSKFSFVDLIFNTD